MTGALRFLYGLALGVSVGLIAARLLGRRRPNAPRPAFTWSVKQRPPAAERRKEEALAR